MARKRSISCRLLKEHIIDPTDALKEDHHLNEVALDGDPVNKRLFAGQAYNNQPRWLSFFDTAEQAYLARLFGAQAAAILFVGVNPLEGNGEGRGIGEPGQNAGARWLAFCFGMAFHSLRPEALETQFGLKVALNRIGQERIKSIDTRRPEDATIQTRSQNSRVGEIFDFGLDTDHIILQAITGKCADVAFGGTLSGSDGLKLNCAVEYADVDAKAEQILQAFESDAYQDLFPWYGSITPVRDRQQIQQLDAELVRLLRAGEWDAIHLAPPEIVDYQHIDAFKFSGDGRNAEGHDDIRIADYLSRFDDEHPITLAHLKAHKVKTKAEDQDRFFDRWTVYKCTCAEIEVDGTLFVLAVGDWYAVVRDFVARINDEVAEIPISRVALPSHRSGESEGDYNARTARDSPELHLFDKSLIQFQGERGRVEFCDLLSEDRHIVHVKKRGRSSLLSHLFMQGYVAAEAFVDHQALREQIRDRIAAVRHLIPEGDPNPQEFEIVFALLHEGQMSLPFFSKVALASIYRQLRRMRFGAAIAWVGPEEED